MLDNERLEALPQDKKKRIIDACLDEFARYGYKNASTNRIVKAAGISKGLLFHYFENKKKLFIYVLDHCISHLMVLMGKYKTSPVSGDLFEMLRQTAKVKLQVAIEEPQMYHILYDVYVNFPEDIKNELMERYGQAFSDYREQLMMCMDTSMLKQGVDAKIVVNLITDFLDGYYKRRLVYFKKLSPDQLLEEMDSLTDDVMKHLDIIKQSVYKN